MDYLFDFMTVIGLSLLGFYSYDYLNDYLNVMILNIYFIFENFIKLFNKNNIKKDSTILKFKFRNEFTHIQRKELEELLESDWFIKNLIKYTPSKINGEDVYEIWEDKSTAMSLFDSLRFSSLIVYPNVSLEYLLLLGEKWGVPECLKEEINKRIELQNEDDKLDNNPIATIIKMLPLKCINCNKGFFANENTSKSCCYHPNYYNNNSNKWACCGREEHNDAGCITGCHVPFTSNQLINMLNSMELKIDD
jgi:hypothetical protein